MTVLDNLKILKGRVETETCDVINFACQQLHFGSIKSDMQIKLAQKTALKFTNALNY